MYFFVFHFVFDQYMAGLRQTASYNIAAFIGRLEFLLEWDNKRDGNRTGMVAHLTNEYLLTR